MFAWTLLLPLLLRATPPDRKDTMHTLSTYTVAWQYRAGGGAATGRTDVVAGSEGDALKQAAANILTGHDFNDPAPRGWAAYVENVGPRNA